MSAILNVDDVKFDDIEVVLCKETTEKVNEETVDYLIEKTSVDSFEMGFFDNLLNGFADGFYYAKYEGKGNVFLIKYGMVWFLRSAKGSGSFEFDYTENNPLYIRAIQKEDILIEEYERMMDNYDDRYSHSGCSSCGDGGCPSCKPSWFI